jgi:hypothetical protein
MEAWGLLEGSAYKQLQAVVAAEDHGFCSGAQHQRKDRYYESPYDTGVFVLQVGDMRLQCVCGGGGGKAVRLVCRGACCLRLQQLSLAVRGLINALLGVQNEQGQERWPIPSDFAASVAEAMAKAVPTDAMKDRRRNVWNKGGWKQRAARGARD